MKFILLVILIFSFRYTIAQGSVLAGTPALKINLIQPINARNLKVRDNKIESYIGADISRKLFSNTLYSGSHKSSLPTAKASAGFLQKPQFFFKKAEYNKQFQYKPSNMTLNTIADITGSVLDVMLQQYSIQNRVAH